MSADPIAVLMSTSGLNIPLRGVSASGVLRGLLFELTVEQRYENVGSTNIEAIYTFPLPLRATLLSLELTIGDRVLKAVAIGRQRASEQYEEAIDKGNSAALVEYAGAGLYTVSVGNLLPHERATIRFRYAELLDYQQGQVRLAIPTAIAPRYGNAEANVAAPHQVPGVDLIAEYPLELAIELEGDIAKARATSPTHDIRATAREDVQRIELTRKAYLDRDFVLLLACKGVPQLSSVARDGDGYVALVSMAPPIAEAPNVAPKALKILLDCSGSMAGDSIAQARRAVAEILKRLGPEDCVSLTRFGNQPCHVTASMTKATPKTIQRLLSSVAEIDADMGGTKMEGALDATLALPSPKGLPADVLLITDGEIWAIEAVLARVANSKHRLFVVAVGAAPAEALARQIAETTGGACEFVTPGEDMETAIVRMARRMREPDRALDRIDWPQEPLWTVMSPRALFSGDTVHMLAGFSAQPVGDVSLHIAGASNAEPLALQLSLDGAVASSDTLSRVAAARRLPALADDQAAELAERYQLVSKFTSYVVVHVRAEGEKADVLPELRGIPQMLAAGWGGTSYTGIATLRDEPVHLSLAAPSRERAMKTFDLDIAPLLEPALRLSDELRPGDLLSEEYDSSVGRTSPVEVADALVSFIDFEERLPESTEELEQLGVPHAIGLAISHAAVTEGHPLSDVIKVWIALLARSTAGSKLEAADRAVLESDVFTDRRFRDLRTTLKPILAHVTEQLWCASALESLP